MSVPMRWSDCISPVIVSYTPLKREKSSGIVRRTRVRFANMAMLIVVSSIIFSLVIVGLVSLSTMLFMKQASTLAVDTEQSLKIRCDTVNVIRRNEFVTVSGDVLNQTTSSLENVEVVVQLQDAAHHTLQMASALVAANTLFPGRTVPFQIEITDDSKAVACHVWFRKLSGASLS